MWQRAAATLLALCIAGCDGDVTELVVVVETDLSIPGETDAIQIVVTGPSGDSETVDTMLRSRDRLPLTLGLVPATDRLRPVTVRAEARLDSATVVEQTVTTGFVEGDIRVVRLRLLRDCIGRSCPEGRTCDAGSCVSSEVAPEELPEWNGSPEPADGGLDARRRDETCNGIDDDLDGFIDEGHDADGDGFTWCGSGEMARQDCRDNDANSFPGAREICDGIDNDCDETVDEEPADEPLCEGDKECLPREGGCIEADCTVTGCPAGERCDLAATPPTCTTEGSRCVSGDCSGGEVCDETTGSCVLPKPLGETCNVDAECESGACVSAEALGLGAGKLCGRACCTSAGCPDGTVCWVALTGARSCMPPSVVGLAGVGAGEPGDDCNTGEECRSGLCSRELGCIGHCTTDAHCAFRQACVFGERPHPAEGAVQGFRCASPPGAGALGETCAEAADCRHGLCIDRTFFDSYCSAPCGTSPDCPSDSEVACQYAETSGDPTVHLPACLFTFDSDSTVCCSDGQCASGKRCLPVHESDLWAMRCTDA